MEKNLKNVFSFFPTPIIYPLRPMLCSISDSDCVHFSIQMSSLQQSVSTYSQQIPQQIKVGDVVNAFWFFFSGFWVLKYLFQFFEISGSFLKKSEFSEKFWAQKKSFFSIWKKNFYVVKSCAFSFFTILSLYFFLKKLKTVKIEKNGSRHDSRIKKI